MCHSSNSWSLLTVSMQRKATQNDTHNLSGRTHIFHFDNLQTWILIFRYAGSCVSGHILTAHTCICSFFWYPVFQHSLQLVLKSKGRLPIKKNVYFRTLPESGGGEAPARIFWPFFYTKISKFVIKSYNVYMFFGHCGLQFHKYYHHHHHKYHFNHHHHQLYFISSKINSQSLEDT